MSKKDDAAIVTGQSPWEGDDPQRGYQAKPGKGEPGLPPSGGSNVTQPLTAEEEMAMHFPQIRSLSLRQELAVRFVKAFARGGYMPWDSFVSGTIAGHALGIADKILESENNG